MITYNVDYEIPFFDVDAYRVVWHGNYPKYWEIARCNLLDKLGIPYQDMEKHGYFFPVVELNTKYIKPLIFGQKVIISATLVEWQNRLKFNYSVKDATTQETCTKGWTKQVAVLMPDNITQFESPGFITHAVDKWLHNNGKPVE